MALARLGQVVEEYSSPELIAMALCCFEHIAVVAVVAVGKTEHTAVATIVAVGKSEQTTVVAVVGQVSLSRQLV